MDKVLTTLTYHLQHHSVVLCICSEATCLDGIGKYVAGKIDEILKNSTSTADHNYHNYNNNNNNNSMNGGQCASFNNYIVNSNDDKMNNADENKFYSSSSSKCASIPKTDIRNVLTKVSKFTTVMPLIIGAVKKKSNLIFSVNFQYFQI